MPNKVATIKLNKSTVSWHDAINNIYLSEFKQIQADVYDDMDYEPIKNGIKYKCIKIIDGKIPEKECDINHDLTSFYNKKEVDEKLKIKIDKIDEQFISIQSEKLDKNIFFAKNNCFVAHRGSLLYPENTIISIIKCSEIGYNWVEVDVAVTSDKKFVLCHDEIVDRIFGNVKTGTLKNLTYDEIKNYDIKVGDCSDYSNEKIAKFEECLKIAKKLNIGLFIHIEYIDISDIQQLVNLIKHNGMNDKCTISSYKMNLIQEVRKYDTDIPVSVFGGYAQDSIDNVKKLKNSFMNVSYEHADSKVKVDAYHQSGMKVAVYTVNDYAKAKLLLENGVDIIITDKLIGGDN